MDCYAIVPECEFVNKNNLIKSSKSKKHTKSAVVKYII